MSVLHKTGFDLRLFSLLNSRALPCWISLFHTKELLLTDSNGNRMTS